MNMRLLLTAALLGCLGAWAAPASGTARSDLPHLDALVQLRSGDPSGPCEEVGTGFFVDVKNRLIFTAEHVASMKSDNVWIVYKDATEKLQRVRLTSSMLKWASSQVDLAILQLPEDAPLPRKALRLAEAPPASFVGDRAPPAQPLLVSGFPGNRCDTLYQVQSTMAEAYLRKDEYRQPNHGDALLHLAGVRDAYTLNNAIITGGYSGAPLVLLGTDIAVGWANKITGEERLAAGFAIQDLHPEDPALEQDPLLTYGLKVLARSAPELAQDRLPADAPPASGVTELPILSPHVAGVCEVGLRYSDDFSTFEDLVEVAPGHYAFRTRRDWKLEEATEQLSTMDPLKPRFPSIGTTLGRLLGGESSTDLLQTTPTIGDALDLDVQDPYGSTRTTTYLRASLRPIDSQDFALAFLKDQAVAISSRTVSPGGVQPPPGASAPQGSSFGPPSADPRHMLFPPLTERLHCELKVRNAGGAPIRLQSADVAFYFHMSHGGVQRFSSALLPGSTSSTVDIAPRTSSGTFSIDITTRDTLNPLAIPMLSAWNSARAISLRLENVHYLDERGIIQRLEDLVPRALRHGTLISIRSPSRTLEQVVSLPDRQRASLPELLEAMGLDARWESPPGRGAPSFLLQSIGTEANILEDKVTDLGSLSAEDQLRWRKWIMAALDSKGAETALNPKAIPHGQAIYLRLLTARDVLGADFQPVVYRGHIRIGPGVPTRLTPIFLRAGDHVRLSNISLSRLNTDRITYRRIDLTPRLPSLSDQLLTRESYQCRATGETFTVITDKGNVPGRAYTLDITPRRIDPGKETLFAYLPIKTEAVPVDSPGKFLHLDPEAPALGGQVDADSMGRFALLRSWLWKLTPGPTVSVCRMKQSPGLSEGIWEAAPSQEFVIGSDVDGRRLDWGLQVPSAHYKPFVVRAPRNGPPPSIPLTLTSAYLGQQALFFNLSSSEGIPKAELDGPRPWTPNPHPFGTYSVEARKPVITASSTTDYCQRTPFPIASILPKIEVPLFPFSYVPSTSYESPFLPFAPEDLSLDALAVLPKDLLSSWGIPVEGIPGTKDLFTLEADLEIVRSGQAKQDCPTPVISIPPPKSFRLPPGSARF